MICMSPSVCVLFQSTPCLMAFRYTDTIHGMHYMYMRVYMQSLEHKKLIGFCEVFDSSVVLFVMHVPSRSKF